MNGQFIEVIAGEEIKNGDLIFIRDGKAYPSWDVRLTRLLQKHDLAAHRRAAAIVITHPVHGTLTMAEMGAESAYRVVAEFLRANGTEP